MTLITLLFIFIRLALIPISFHFIFLLFFNLKTKLWLNKYKNILLSNSNISNSYSHLIKSRKNNSNNIDDSSHFIELLHSIYNNYVDFCFFEEIFKCKKHANCYGFCIREFSKIKIYFLIDTLSLKLFNLYIQFLFVFTSIIIISSIFFNNNKTLFIFI